MRKNQFSIWLCILLVGLTSCRAEKNNPDATVNKPNHVEPEVQFPIAKGDVKLSGLIKEYKAIYKTGKLSYREPIADRVIETVFLIAGDGSFNINLDLLHPVKVNLDLEGAYYSIFLEPNHDYEFAVEEKSGLVFNKNGIVNEQLKVIRSAMRKQFKSDDSRKDKIFYEELPVKDFMKFHDDLARAKLQFLDEFCSSNDVGNKARTVLKSEIEFTPAAARVNFSMYDFTSGMPRLRQKLPASIVSETLKAYPLNAGDDACSSGTYTGFIGLLSDVLQFGASPDDTFAFYESNGEYTSEELELVKGMCQRDKKVMKSEAFAKFYTTENMLKANRLSTRSRVATVLREAALLPPGIGRDILVSRTVGKNFFERDLIVPSESEWKQIKQLIDNPAILNHLASLPTSTLAVKQFDADPQAVEGDISFAEVRKKYIDVYRGKVIYIDFYSTWCAPCRFEIPRRQTIGGRVCG